MTSENSILVPSNVKIGFSPETEYDLNIAILTYCGDRNMHRIDCMKRLGVINSKDYKIHITLIVNPGDFSKFDLISEGWSATDDVSILEMPSSMPIPKINGYYLWLMDSLLSARWHGRVDDDSMTDIASAIRYLDQNFGDTPVHVATGPMPAHEYEPLFVPFLLEQGIFLQDARTEYESSFTSASGMRQIFSDKLGRWLIEESGRRFTNPGDRALAFAAHVSKVPVVENPASRYWFELDQFTLLGGDLHHIHYVPWHQKELSNRLAAYFTHGEEKITNTLVEDLVGSPLQFHAIHDPNALITLAPSKAVIGGDEIPVASWDFESDCLNLYSACGTKRASFSEWLPHDGGLFLRGNRPENGRPCLLQVDAVIKDVRPRRQRAFRPINQSLKKPVTGYYLRLGNEGRQLHFENNGSISTGADVCERRWSLKNVGDGIVLDIEGDSGLTCRLFLGADGIWRGRWVIAERTPVAIIMMA